MERETILYLINHIECEIPILIEKVLCNDEKDPHYSAVYVSNLIKICIELYRDINEALPYSNVKEYFLQEESREVFLKFKKIFDAESKEYIGKIY